MLVNYTEIRSNVIQKLTDENGNLETILTNLTNTVNDIISCKYLQGGTADAYIEEFNNTVSTTFARINDNVLAIAEQLESVCQTYENLDADLHDTLSS